MKINPVSLYVQKISYTGALSKEKKEELERRAQAVKQTLEKAASEQRKMTTDDVAKEAGFTTCETRYVFRHYADIDAIWKKVRTNNSDRLPVDKIAKKKAEIKAVLLNAKENNETMTIEDLAAKAHSTPGATAHYLDDEDLNSIWFWVKTKSPSSFTKEEMQEQTRLIKEQLELAIKNKKAVTIPEISEATGIDENVIDDRIDGDETLSVLREQTLKFEDKNYRREIKLINDVMQEAKEAGLKITQVYISQKTSIPVGTVQKRISQNKKLEKLFDEVRVREHAHNSKEEIEAQNAKIAAILNRAIQSGKKITISDLAAEYTELKKNTIQSRLGRYPELGALWEQAKVESDVNYCPKEDEIKEQTKKIEQILTEYKSKGEKITGKKLGELAGITPRMAMARISKSEKLTALWNALCSPNAQYTKEEIEVQNVMIERILNQRIQDKMKAVIYQMAQYLELSRDMTKRRIEENPRLLALYQRSQQFEN